ncbi:MAG: helix-turn-helix domain-containing protein [Chloroflexota bacterium]
MPLEIYYPQLPLADYVSMMWQWDDYHPSHDKELILPIGMMELTISLSDTPFCIESCIPNNSMQQIHGAMLVGARSKPFIVHTDTPRTIVSVLFKFGGALQFFNVAGKDLLNQHIRLDDIWDTTKTQELYEQLGMARTSLERFCILENLLLNRINHQYQRHDAVGYTLSKLIKQPMIQRIKPLIEDANLSATRLIQVFRDDIGMTPKQFQRVRRFHRALNIISVQTNPNWAEIALDCGYYDQAHFNNEFRHFSGLTPSAYTPQSVDHNINLAISDNS